MKYAIAIFFGLLIMVLSSCGFNGDQKLSIRDSMHTIAVDLRFIQQIKDLCTAQTLRDEYESEALYNKAIADCTFKNLSLINLQQLQNFQDQNCDPNADLSGLTPQQIADVQSACAILGGGH